jgi:hypothetical protein
MAQGASTGMKEHIMRYCRVMGFKALLVLHLLRAKQGGVGGQCGTCALADAKPRGSSTRIEGQMETLAARDINTPGQSQARPNPPKTICPQLSAARDRSAKQGHKVSVDSLSSKCHHAHRRQTCWLMVITLAVNFLEDPRFRARTLVSQKTQCALVSSRRPVTTKAELVDCRCGLTCHGLSNSNYKETKELQCQRNMLEKSCTCETISGGAHMQ